MSESGGQNPGGTPNSSNVEQDVAKKYSSALTTGSTGAASAVSVTDLELAGGSDSRVVTARGTEDGLVLRIDGKADWQDILHDINLFLGGRKKFFEGGQVSLEWLDRLPLIEQSKELENLLRSAYGIEVVVRRRRPPRFSIAESAAARAELEGNPDFDATRDSIGRDMSNRKSNRRSGVTINLFQEVAENSESANLDSGMGREKISSDRPRSEEAAYSLEQWEERERVLKEAAAAAAGNSAPHSNFDLQHSESFPNSINNSNSRASYSGGGSSGGYGDSFGGEINPRKYASRMAKMLGDDLFYEDDANAKIVFATLRSGQRLETPFSLIIIGDVNPGADLVAGGDILVFGGLRGTAHASAYDDDAHDRVIIAMQMQPMQLRIGSVISRGSDELVKGAEIARIENRRIIVEAFNPRALMGKKFR